MLGKTAIMTLIPVVTVAQRKHTLLAGNWILYFSAIQLTVKVTVEVTGFHKWLYTLLPNLKRFVVLNISLRCVYPIVLCILKLL